MEDRINALFYTRHLIDNGKKPDGFIRLSRKLRHIVSRDDVSKKVTEKWQKEAHRRNSKFHQAMWNIDEFKEEDCKRVIDYAREADKLKTDAI